MNRGNEKKMTYKYKDFLVNREIYLEQNKFIYKYLICT